MSWLKANLLVITFLLVLELVSQIPRDTSYTVQSTVKKVAKYYTDLKVEGVLPSHPYSVETRSSIEYKNLGYRTLTANMFLPKGEGRKPAVLLIHGGGWRAGAPDLMTPLAEQVAAAGYVVLVPEYRLSLEARYPAGKDDLIDAIEWLKNQSSKFQVDTTKIAVMGCSAGGQLAALIGTTYPVQAIIDVDGVLAFKHPDSQEGEVASQWLGGTYEEIPNVWEEASALTHVDATTPPTLFLASKYPRFLAGREEFMRVLQNSDIHTEVYFMEDAPHSFWLLTPWFEPTVERTLEFLNKTLKAVK
ncbi:alpha/beta hydrolase [Marinoscillum pacificum]|uniref:alpha/beta hydrolase n=1 Tax=Marinoscillum pacificum TaxID=392723 RepID=UPI00215878B3|nr:alpha/beta hydrolase [Marinoscillum pacificum]